MPAKEMSLNKSDLVLLCAAAVGLLVVALSVYAFFFSPVDKERAAAFKDLFEVVVKGTLLPLFVTLVTTKVAYTAARYVLNKFPDK